MNVELPVEVLLILRQVAWRPTDGADNRCAFCQAYPSQSHSRYSFAGTPSDCPVVMARKILQERGESIDHYSIHEKKVA